MTPITCNVVKHDAPPSRCPLRPPARDLGLPRPLSHVVRTAAPAGFPSPRRTRTRSRRRSRATAPSTAAPTRRCCGASGAATRALVHVLHHRPAQRHRRRRRRRPDLPPDPDDALARPGELDLRRRRPARAAVLGRPKAPRSGRPTSSTRSADRPLLPDFVVTDTDDAVSGEPGACNGDSAIGVAVSDSPTGPWTVSRRSRRRAAARPEGTGCDFCWTFDPDVLGDAVGAASILYYGSYYGGIFATQVALRPPDGARVRRRDHAGSRSATATRAANVVRRDGCYYLFASATNCCNGPLTGYSVFAGRSRSPLGPFVDREGTVAAGRSRRRHAGALTMNGNRWVGTGHNTRLPGRGRRSGGRSTTPSTAPTPTSPFEPGFTKRPALLDPARLGRRLAARCAAAGGPPTSRMPAPAAQPGQRTALPRRRRCPPPRRDACCRRTPTTSTAPASTRRWSWVREPRRRRRTPSSDGAPALGHPGRRPRPRQQHRLGADPSRAPRGDYVVQTRVRLDLPAEGCCYNYVQAGLVVYGRRRPLPQARARLDLGDPADRVGQGGPARPPEFPRYGNTRGRSARGRPPGCGCGRAPTGRGPLHRLHQPGRRTAGCAAAPGPTTWAPARDRPGVDGWRRASSPGSSTSGSGGCG